MNLKDTKTSKLMEQLVAEKGESWTALVVAYSQAMALVAALRSENVSEKGVDLAASVVANFSSLLLGEMGMQGRAKELTEDAVRMLDIATAEMEECEELFKRYVQ